jgi:hypothetical protein
MKGQELIEWMTKLYKKIFIELFPWTFWYIVVDTTKAFIFNFEDFKYNDYMEDVLALEFIYLFINNYNKFHFEKEYNLYDIWIPISWDFV